MTFQILGLPANSFQEFFDLDSTALAEMKAERRAATAFPGLHVELVWKMRK